MSNLFIVMLGGRHKQANIEIHDIVFVIGHTLEETYPQLRQAWFGEQKGLHIDAWMKVNGIESDGIYYQIKLTQNALNAHHRKLFFLNLGGYSELEFGELHRYILVVAPDMMTAKQRGKAYIHSEWIKPHTDQVLEVDDCIAVNHVNGYQIELIENQSLTQNNLWENCYIPIDHDERF
ncbi:hypothetical protein B9T31_14205 [Acinetobacter sp. ANC 4558]|uniref:DUF1543 domain-containing protein n=1 Tax=Acinetobacter sp. ANC 4558 TaxID=1977876 RepID=UPI000A344F12|nr:DUF1543 domain-containing protein [Acinetobacter sp. ANC 4558]OTG83239.1 hypothetical protein B9T31_14205 [Acinetobacter sp. ANC 4558]